LRASYPLPVIWQHPRGPFWPRLSTFLSRCAEVANYFASSRVRALYLGKQPEPQYPLFSPDDWFHAQRLREAVDSAAHILRWCITVIPAGDPRPRNFVLCGSLASVTRRAQSIFADQTRVLAITPEPTPGGESFDKALSLSLPGEF